MPRVVANIESPDRTLRLEVTTRATFPALDFLDPEGAAYFRLIDARSGGMLAEARAFVWEIDDVQAPAVQWLPSQVLVSGFDPSALDTSARLRYGSAER